MPAMRLSGRRGDVAAQPPMQFPPTIICPVCGLRNDIAIRFCRNCGLPLGAPRDPVRGTTTKRADLPSDRGTGIAAIVGGAGFLIYKGFHSTTGTANAGPTSTRTARSSSVPAASPTVTLPTRSITPATSGFPAETDEPTATNEPTSTDAPTASNEPAAIGTVSAWTCKRGAIADPLDGKWRISRTTWNKGASTDRLTLTLTRVSGTTRTGSVVNLAYTSPTRAASKYGITRPLGDHAIVLTFDGAITVGSAQIGTPALKALESVDVRRDASGIAHAIVGITGTGCARLNAPEWKNGSDTIQTASITLDVRR